MGPTGIARPPDVITPETCSYTALPYVPFLWDPNVVVRRTHQLVSGYILRRYGREGRAREAARSCMREWIREMARLAGVDWIRTEMTYTAQGPRIVAGRQGRGGHVTSCPTCRAQHQPFLLWIGVEPRCNGCSGIRLDRLEYTAGRYAHALRVQLTGARVARIKRHLTDQVVMRARGVWRFGPFAQPSTLAGISLLEKHWGYPPAESPRPSTLAAVADDATRLSFDNYAKTWCV